MEELRKSRFILVHGFGSFILSWLGVCCREQSSLGKCPVYGGEREERTCVEGFLFPHFPIFIWGPCDAMVHSRSPTAVSPLGKHPHRCRCILRGALVLSWACLYPTTLTELVTTMTQRTQPSCFCHSDSIVQSMIVQYMT